MTDEQFESHCAWFEKNLRIVDKNGKLSNFVLNPIQRRLERWKCEQFEKREPAFAIVLKARQEGVSTWAEGTMFRDGCEMETRTSIVVAHNEASTRRIFEMARRFLKYFPVKIETEKSSARALHLSETQSEFIVQTAGAEDSAGRGYTAQALHVSELDYCPDPYALLAASMQTIPDVYPAFVVLESTAAGPGGAMETECRRAMDGKSAFFFFFFAWHADPTYRMPMTFTNVIKYLPDDFRRQNRQWIKALKRQEETRGKLGRPGPAEPAGSGSGSEEDIPGRSEGERGTGTEAVGSGDVHEGPTGEAGTPGGGPVHRLLEDRREAPGPDGAVRSEPLQGGRGVFREDAPLRGNEGTDNPGGSGGDDEPPRRLSHAIFNHVELFKASLTPYEMGLWEEFKLDYEQLLWRRYCLETKCSGSESTMKREYPSCVAEGQQVFTRNGVQAIETVVPDRAIIQAKFDKGEKEVRRLRTKLGYELVCTPDHLIKTPSGFVRLEDLNVGDSVLLGSDQTPSDGPQTLVLYSPMPCVEATILIGEEFAELLGFYMGDGSFHRDCVSICCDSKDRDAIDRIKYLMETHLGGTVSERTVGTRGGGTELRVNNRRFEQVFNALGLLRQNSSFQWKRRVHIPDYIKRSPHNVARAFLRGLFEADGFAQRKANGVKFFTKYEDFGRDVQLMLLRFGISCRRTAHDKKSGTGTTYTGWELSLRSSEGEAFARSIGFVSARKQDRVSAPPRSHFNRLPLATHDEIVSVVPHGTARVYDLTTHNQEFVAGGIVVHNCPEEAFEANEGAVLDQAVLSRWVKEAEATVPSRGSMKSLVHPTLPLMVEFDHSDKQGKIEVYEPPRHGHRYVMGVDAGNGVAGGDDTVGFVLDIDTGLQAAEFRAIIDPDLAVDQVEALAIWYNKAMCAVETNGGFGGPYLRHILDRKQVPVYERVAFDKLERILVKRPGWDTSTRTRPMLFAALREGVRKETIRIKSRATLSECRTLHEKKTGDVGLGRIEARPGCHDDGVMACGIALMVANGILQVTRNSEAARRNESPFMKRLNRMAKMRDRALNSGVFPANHVRPGGQPKFNDEGAPAPRSRLG